MIRLKGWKTTEEMKESSAWIKMNEWSKRVNENKWVKSEKWRMNEWINKLSGWRKMKQWMNAINTH